MAQPKTETLSAFPSTWLTKETIKTISGAATCAWLTTMFFDLLVLAAVSNKTVHERIVLFIGITLSIVLSIYKFASGKKRQFPWLLIIPNAFLVFVHSLGFQVATKEISMRLYEEDIKQEIKSEQQTSKQGFLDLFKFLSRQSSWLPDLKASILEKQNEQLVSDNQKLKDTINSLRPASADTSSLYQLRLNREAQQTVINSLRDSLKKAEDHEQFMQIRVKRLIVQRDSVANSLTHVKDGLLDQITSLNGQVSALNSQVANLTNQLHNIDQSCSKVRKDVASFNSLLNQWKTKTASNRELDRQMENIMDKYMGSGFYKKLLQPIPIK